ncbi:charged multivesicular body protein 7-like [Argiope bruennichi]|uniref:charged multivesicular body protein 7-like n=1 Tax=Argiope bruennichi TaxID=94029 RepID=UPI002493EEE6|nr:charged multivesicular body protein 7-like [Argiope bruennichi]
MSLELHFRRSDFPIDWNDDIRMNFLFSPFRERSVNPEGYDAKINFWISTIQDLCMKSQCPVISNTALCAAFDRKNRQPVCLDIVLENMMRQGLIMRMNDYTKIEQEKGWLGWSFDMLVQKPVSWGFSSVHSLLNFNKTEEKFIILSVVKDLSAKILKRYYELIDTKWTDNAVFLEHLRQECKDICSESNFELAVMQLQREKIASVFEEYGEKVIKFRKFEEKKIEPLSEIDKGVLSLKRARDTILDDMDALETSILSCEEEAKNLVKKGFKSKAMLSLKKKKRLETLLKKKSIAFDNIENLLCQLKNTGTEKMVLEAYRTGVQAMKRTTTGELDLDNIDVVMSDVQGVLEDYNEVQSTLSKSVTADDSLEEFEEELENLIAEDKSPVKEKRRKESTPRVNDDELLKRLEALRAPPEDISPIKKPTTVQKPLRAP